MSVDHTDGAGDLVPTQQVIEATVIAEGIPGEYPPAPPLTRAHHLEFDRVAA